MPGTIALSHGDPAYHEALSYDRDLDLRQSIIHARRLRKSSRKSMIEVDPESYVGYSKEAPLLDLITYFVCCKCNKYLGSPRMRPRGNTMQLQKKQDEEEAEKEQKWFGLFTDLIFVAVIVQFAFQMKFHYKGFYTLPEPSDSQYMSNAWAADHDSACEALFSETHSEIVLNSDGRECAYRGGIDVYVELIIQTSHFWFVFFVAWLELSCGLGRFINISGFLDDILYCAYLITIIGMCVQIYPWNMMTKYVSSFTLWLSMAFCVQMLIHLLYYYVVDECRNYAWRRIWTYAIAIVINSIGGYFTFWVNYAAMLVSCGIVFYVSLTSFIPQKQTNLTVDHFVERFGLLIMISTGECILSLIIGNESDDSYAQTFNENAVILLSFTIMYIVKDVYFNSDAPANLHALTKTELPSACLWVFLHFPLSYCILTVGVGFMLIVADIKTDLQEHGLILCIPLSVALLIIDLLRLTHTGFRWSIWSILFRGINMLAIPLGYLIIKNQTYLLVWCAGWTFSQLFRDYIFKENYHAAHLLHMELRPADKQEVWNEWIQMGFMGPKVELWPPYLLVDWWKKRTGASRVKELHGDIDYHPNEHTRNSSQENTRDWLMEFADLIFVGVIWKFADQMKYTMKLYTEFDVLWVVLESTVFFSAFFCIWLELVSEFVRFQNMPGFLDDLARYVYLCGVLLMAIQMEPNQYLMANIRGFLASFVISLTSIFVLHVCYLYYKVNDALRYCRWRVGIYVMVITSTIITIPFDEYWLNLCTLILNVITLFVYSINSFRVTENSTDRDRRHAALVVKAQAEGKVLDEPIEDHILERFGLFVMIVSGESILALVIGSVNYDQEFITYLLIYIAFFMVFLIKIMYFMHNPELLDGHGLLKHEFPGAVAFCGIHLVLCLFLLWLGVSWKLIFYKWSGSGAVDSRWRTIFGISVTGVITSLVFNRFTHSKFQSDYLSYLRLIPIFAVPFVCSVMVEPIHFSIGCLSCFALLYIMDYKFFNHHEINELHLAPAEATAEISLT